MGIKVLFLYKKPSYFCLSFLERKEKYYWCWFLVPKVFCSVSVSVHGSRPAKMRGGRQAACRHGPARHFSLNTLFFISFQPTNLASTPPPSLILDTTHITKVTLGESPWVTPYTSLHCRQHPMFPHERKLQQLQQQRQLVEQLRREAAINRITVSQVRRERHYDQRG